MTPEDIVLQLKRNGTFDDLRKRLLSGFQHGEQGKEFTSKLNAFMADMISKDPSLLNSTSIYEKITKELERSGIYQTLQQQVLQELQTDYYQNRITEQVDIVYQDTD
ncbi:hypothetical protein CU097_008656 [Rhizopus azygosporus]|uniref:BOD1/SHG1 domain-containing protein n=1 Tax=Rhizopus azygosporus TaxID=86630 RepID=A0A367JYM5_RHIAZ|nr:hypothetical protein CU097_008656 [Rhizopus azygosporus]CEG72688.1 hypothetical protein RMATCC62417_08199 [Rhizopus microsporus]